MVLLYTKIKNILLGRNINMLIGLFQNACILISFLCFVQHFLREKHVFNELTRNGKIMFGIFGGLLGIILILNNVQITSNIIIDFRYIPILLSAFYGGLLPSIISSVLIGIFRLFFLGVSDTSINGFIVAIIIGIGFGLIALLKSSKNIKWIYSATLFILVVSISMWIALKDRLLFSQTILIFLLSYFVVSFFVIKYTDYLIEVLQIHQKLKNEATKDYLTGLNNVRQFDKSFNSLSQMTLRKEEDLSLLIIDIDFFKKVNDTYGHNAGDKVLKGLATILVDTCRTYDVVSRNGGEEFSILLLDCSAGKALQIAERVRKNVEVYNFLILEKQSINITISIGIASYPETTDQIDNLPENADTALYQAKKTGRNKVVLFNND
jgi:diguanylate cyclase